MIVMSQLPIQTAQIFYRFWRSLVPPFWKGSATHDSDSEKAVHQTNLPDLLTISWQKCCEVKTSLIRSEHSKPIYKAAWNNTRTNKDAEQAQNSACRSKHGGNVSRVQAWWWKHETLCPKLCHLQPLLAEPKLHAEQLPERFQ